MRDQLWDLLYRMKHAEIYAQHYRNRIGFLNMMATIFLSIVSAGSIAGWFVWSQIPILWSLLLATSQIIQITRQHLPFASHRCALKFYIPALSKLVVEMIAAWNTCAFEDNDACVLIHHQFLRDFNNLKEQYFGDVSIKSYKELQDKSEKECDIFFEQFGLVLEGESIDDK